MLTALVITLTSGAMVAQVPATSGQVESGNIPPRVEKFLKSCETSRRGAIASLEYELRGLLADKSGSRKTSSRIARVEANLAALRANKEPVVPALRFPPEIGAIGRLPRLACHIEQILADDQMLVRCQFSLKVRTVKQFQPRLETVVRPVTFLVRGLSTRKLTAGAEVQLLDVFEISGQHTYQSVAGKPITVLVLKPFDMKAIEPYFRAMASGQ